jgi:hypothetical protein
MMVFLSVVQSQREFNVGLQYSQDRKNPGWKSFQAGTPEQSWRD